MEDQKKQDGIYDARTLRRERMLPLGLQHMFAVFDAAVLVSIPVDGYFHGKGLSVQVTLFMAGAGALSSHLYSKSRVSAFLGSSFAFLGGFVTVAELNTGVYANMSYREKLPYACGSVVVAGLLYLILATVIRLIGVKRIMHFLSPVVTGPIIICIGLSLADAATSSAETNWLFALIALCTIVIFNVWGKDIFRIIPILMDVVVAYTATLVFYATGLRNADGSAVMNFSRIAGSPMFGVPPFQLCKFDLTAVLVMAPIAITTMMECIGGISAISATVGENFIGDPGLHRISIGGGPATSFSAFFGGLASTAYSENTGILELSHVYDPQVIRLTAFYAILLSFVPRFAAVLASLSTAIIGGISFIPYSMISAIGVRSVIESHADSPSSRNLIIAMIILVSGPGLSKGLSFTVFGTSVTLTVLTIASVAGVLLNAILPGSDYHFRGSQCDDTVRGISMKN